MRLRMTDGRAWPISTRRGVYLSGAATVLCRTQRSAPALKAMVQRRRLRRCCRALKAKRRGLAEAAKVPAYIIFNDRTLIEMARKRASTLDAMARIGGLGRKARELRRLTFLEVIQRAAAEIAPDAPQKLAGAGPAGSVFGSAARKSKPRLSRGADGGEKSP